MIEAEACGICGAKARIQHCTRRAFRDTKSSAASQRSGSSVSAGVGRLGGHCDECVQCRRGEFQLCRNQPFVAATCDGGYAEMILARSTGLVSIPTNSVSRKQAHPVRIVAAIGKVDVLSNLMNALAPQGCLVVLGEGKDPLSVSTGHLVTGERSVVGSITSAYEIPDRRRRLQP